MKKKWKILLVICITAVGLGFFIYENTKSLEADVLKVQPRTISQSFKEEGLVVPEVEQPVFAQYGGTIINLAVEEGQTVKKGQLLAVLDSQELDYQTKIKELELEQAQRDLENVESNYKRIEQLYYSKAVTQKEYEDAKSLLEKAKNNLELQKAQLKIPQYQKERYTIVSPLDGTAANLTVKNGEIVNPQTALMNIFKDDNYAVEVFVPAEDTPAITKGMPVDLIQDVNGEDFVFKGQVEKIAPTAEEKVSALGLTEQRVKITIRPEKSDNVKLFPGCSIDVEFALNQQDDVLAVPKSALFPYKNSKALWVVSNGRAEIHQVKTGAEYNSETVIVEGLNAGDLVIINAQLDGLKEGKKINPLF